MPARGAESIVIIIFFIGKKICMYCFYVLQFRGALLPARLILLGFGRYGISFAALFFYAAFRATFLNIAGGGELSATFSADFCFFGNRSSSFFRLI
jgi:hypothetical protein